MLDASSSQFTGSLSDDIQKFSSLQYLDLSNNHLNETISEMVWKLPQLALLQVSSNFFKGAISKNIGKTKILSIDLSNNSLKGIPYESHMSNLSCVEKIDLSSCSLGPRFPTWIQSLHNRTHLDIANTGISGRVPMEFWNMWPSQLTYLDLSSNNFDGPVPNVSSTLRWLDLSRNKFYGGISFLCQISDRSLSFLDLSHNSFTGKIPECLWHFKDLKVLNLGQNNLHGRLHTSIGYLINLEVLYLYNNSFSGELPSSLKNCSMLTFLVLGANEFSGYIPISIGERLAGLYALSLTSNQFSGAILLQLCQLPFLQILDLSNNKLRGNIPSCLNNIIAMVDNGLSPYQNLHSYNGSRYIDHAVIKWQGGVREFSNNLGMLKSIDLSSNNLSGQIPNELTDLLQVMQLNLSNNALFGKIPHKIGEMKQLQILDLSRNKFSGGIPLSMSQLTLLSYLDVSYNNLSGRIPSGTQLQSFLPSMYAGNVALCGPPLTNYFREDKELKAPTFVDQNEGGGEGIDELERWFYIGGATGFVVGFWITCGALLVNRRGRKAFFDFYDSFNDWVYIKVAVFIAKWQQATHT
ncbi:putative leucine-rich repeat domain superfamily [Helianthus annuus]|nr:putative leucine-rich repeat domain superfamily [Helianthus annuus]